MIYTRTFGPQRELPQKNLAFIWVSSISGGGGVFCINCSKVLMDKRRWPKKFKSWRHYLSIIRVKTDLPKLPWKFQKLGLQKVPHKFKLYIYIFFFWGGGLNKIKKSCFLGGKPPKQAFCHVKVIANPFSWKSKAPD